MGLFNAALSIIIVSLLSITGIADAPYEYQGRCAFPSEYMSFAVGGFLVGPDDSIQHEYGHLLQEEILKEAYIPIALGVSLLGYGMAMRGNLTAEQYHQLPTEKWADELWRMK